jgi:hypothetical protein
VRTLRRRLDNASETHAAIQRYGVLTTDQVRRLVFPNVSQNSSSPRQALAQLKEEQKIIGIPTQILSGIRKVYVPSDRDVEYDEASLLKWLFVNDVGISYEIACKDNRGRMWWRNPTTITNSDIGDGFIKLENRSKVVNIWIVLLEQTDFLSNETERVQLFAQSEINATLLYVCDNGSDLANDLVSLMASSQEVKDSLTINATTNILVTTTNDLFSNPLGEVYTDPLRRVIGSSGRLNPWGQSESDRPLT